MSEPTPTKEPLETRAANWLNGVMWYGLSSLVMLFGLWSFLGSFGEVRAIIGAFPLPEDLAPPRESSAVFALLGAGMLLGGWRKRRAAK